MKVSPKDVSSNNIDKKKCSGYIAPLVFLVLFLSSTWAWANPVVVRGAVLPSGSSEVGRDRYRSPSNWTETLSFFSKQYKTNPRKEIVNQSDLKAVHIANDSSRGEWEGLNVYELDGETRIFVVARDSARPSGTKAK